MAGVYSWQMYAAQVPATPDTILWTVPAGETWVVRDIIASPSGAGAVDTLVLYLGNLNVYLARAVNVATGDQWTWSGRAVMRGGQDLRRQAGTRIWRLWISGYRLNAPLPAGP